VVAAIAEPGTGVPVREGVYEDLVVAGEPGGVELIPVGERHGRPLEGAAAVTAS
jgi:NCS1 family nucleobase:cation symporter-1